MDEKKQQTVKDFLSTGFLYESLEVIEMFLDNVLDSIDEDSTLLTDEEFDELDSIHSQIFQLQQKLVQKGKKLTQ